MALGELDAIGIQKGTGGVTFRYIGSKARMTDAIRAAAVEHLSNRSRFIDGFAGTGAVAAAMADEGIPIVVNDTLHSAVTMSLARTLAGQQVEFQLLGGYAATVDALNKLTPITGFIRRHYSPASLLTQGIERRYFTEANAGKIDAIRLQIKRWYEERQVTRHERTLLLGDLISAVNRAANIAGTYGCFLSSWQKSALDPIALKCRELRLRPVDVVGIVGDVHDLIVKPDDVVYFDPPYTKRQYASYYHILETIMLHDQPIVEGVSGLRPWREKASIFCYKRKALPALVNLITSTRAKATLLSYSCEGHVDLDELVALLDVSGKISVQAIDRIGRYRPNVVASDNGDTVTEYLISFTPTTAIKASHQDGDRMLAMETA